MASLNLCALGDAVRRTGPGHAGCMGLRPGNDAMNVPPDLIGVGQGWDNRTECRVYLHRHDDEPRGHQRGRIWWQYPKLRPPGDWAAHVSGLRARGPGRDMGSGQPLARGGAHAHAGPPRRERRTPSLRATGSSRVAITSQRLRPTRTVLRRGRDCRVLASRNPFTCGRSRRHCSRRCMRSSRSTASIRRGRDLVPPVGVMAAGPRR